MQMTGELHQRSHNKRDQATTALARPTAISIAAGETFPSNIQRVDREEDM